MLDKRIFLSIDEYAYFGGGFGRGVNLKLALAYGMIFHEMLRHTDFLTMSAHTMGVSTLDITPTASTFNTTGLLFKMYGDHMGEGMLPVAVSGNSPLPPPKYSVSGDQPRTNLAGRMKLTGINQLWVADITYIRLKAEFVYLAVILDGHSRKVVGWALERTLASRLAVSALERAIVDRQPPPGLVHHSDRGIQYAGAEYTAILKRHGMVPSMSRPANPYDNASCESFIKTLKREEIYARRYDNLEHLRANIEEFIEEYYNRQRLHSALGYRSPEEFEQQSESSSAAADLRSATMQFFENEVNDKRVSEVVTGEGGLIVAPFPRPHPLLTDTGNTQ